MSAPAFGRRLRWQREQAGLDTRPLALRLGMARETLNRLENGHQGTRPNVYRVRRAAEVFGLPEYYFTTESFKEIMARMISELSLPELVQLTSPGKRLSWSIDRLTKLFPPQEFDLQRTRQRLGISAKDLSLYCEDKAIPPPLLLAAFSEETGVPLEFLTAGHSEKEPLTFEAVIEEAQRRGLTPEQLRQAMNALYPTRGLRPT